MKYFDGKVHYPIDLEALPRGWTCAFVGEVCGEIQSGFASGEHNAAGKGVPHLRPMNIDRTGRLDMSVIKSVAATVDARRLNRGDVLFNNTNSPVLIGKTAAISRDGDLAFSNHMTRLRPLPVVDYEFLAHHLHYLWRGGYFLHRCSKHVNQASISTETLASSVPVAVPPTPEQRAIVEAIDSYLTRLDDAIASLDRVQAKLKVYRSSVLKAAVEGRLVPTEAALARDEKRDYEPGEVLLGRILKERRRLWEEAELAGLKAAGMTPKDGWRAKYEEPVAPDTSRLPELPEGWCWASVEQLSSEERRSIQSGPFGSNLLHSEFQHEGKLVVGIDNVQDGYFSIGAEHRISEEKFRELEHYRARGGDVLITVMATVGRTCVIPDTLEPAIITKHVYRITPNRRAVEPSYLHLALWGGPAVREQMFGQVIGQTRPGLNGGIIRKLAIPLPPMKEQARVVEAADRLLSARDQTSAQLSTSALRVQRLRQAVLKWAFDGRLVDQNPTDEPAERLLARIRAERAAAAPTRKRRGRKAEGAA